MHDLTGKKVAILATHGFEQSELEVPLQKLREAGAAVDVGAPEEGEIKGWDQKDWGRTVPVDRALDEASASDYDALVLPGGQINPDTLRDNKAAVDLVRAIWDAKKPIGAICHGPWLLVEAGIAKNRRMTSYSSIRTDVVNAGGLWEDSQVVTAQGSLPSGKHEGSYPFCNKL